MNNINLYSYICIYEIYYKKILTFENVKYFKIKKEAIVYILLFVTLYFIVCNFIDVVYLLFDVNYIDNFRYNCFDCSFGR